MKHIICFSGGESSAKVALEVAHKYGTNDLILLNHNINSQKENADIKRFKIEISAYLKVPITYANHKDVLDDNLITNQFDLCIKEKQLTTPRGEAICTSRLKTKPFYKYLDKFHPEKDCIIYYGFDKKEIRRVQRRSSVMAAKGYKTEFPLFSWKNLHYKSTLDIGIEKPGTYSLFEHANCIGCLKAGLLHWYVVYCTDKKTYMEGVNMEDQIGFTIHTVTRNGEKKPMTLRELMPTYCLIQAMKCPATEHQNKMSFGRALTKLGFMQTQIIKPCECVL